MQRTFLIPVLITAFLLLAILKTHEQRSLKTYVRGQKTIKLKNFGEAMKKLSPQDQELLELWESVLTGRSAPISKEMKETFRKLGLNHVFTPSGFHLSAVLSPLLKITRSLRFHLALLLLIGITLLFQPGFGALKRMVTIKTSQRLLGIRSGFLVALLLDVLLGTFQHSPASFSYSFLFLGIIYSGARGLGLIFWFFIGQLVLAYFQGNLISPLLLFWSPVLNGAFALVMPVLLILAVPLWDWQLQLGLLLLGGIKKLLLLASLSIGSFPLWEIHIVVLLIVLGLSFRKGRVAILCLLLLSNSLNLDLEKVPSAGTYEIAPQAARCRRWLVRGHWWERCSPLIRPGRRTRIRAPSTSAFSRMRRPPWASMVRVA